MILKRTILTLFYIKNNNKNKIMEKFIIIFILLFTHFDISFQN